MKGIAASNQYDSLSLDAENADASFSGRKLPLMPDEHPMPEIPDIPHIDLLNESQKTFLMLQFAEKMGLKPGEGVLPPTKTTKPTVTAASTISASGPMATPNSASTSVSVEMICNP